MGIVEAERPRGVRALIGLAISLLLSAALVSLPLTPAHAVGPELTIEKSAPSTVLPGEPVDYSLSATNPDQANATDEFNVSFRDELPVGVTYQPGSTSPASAGDPIIFVDAEDGHQTLIWDNIFDLPVGASESVGFSVDIDTDVHLVGSTFSNTGDVYANTDPRTVAKFDGNGDPIDGFTESASSSPVETSVTAIKITKSEGSPESELLRGVHNFSTIYTLTVRGSSTASNGGVTVVDYLSSGLEFLGCGDVDNSADVEYPGAPALTAIPNVNSDCPTPESVSTVQNPPDRPAGVYTRVEWNLGNLPAGGVETIRYRAGIPQQRNTMTFPGGAPAPDSLGQAANLDNNTGASTREGESETEIRNFAETSGNYTGEIVPGTSRAVSDSTVRGVTAEDVALQKSVSPASFNGGGVATYTLLISASEYADGSDLVLTDTLPNGMCPLSDAVNYAPGAPAECAPGGGFAPTGASFDNVVANADGTYDITFTPSASAANGTVTITYQARMRTVYGSDGLPTVSGDDFVNTVELNGETVGAPGVNEPEPGTGAVTDDSSAALVTDRPVLDKQIQPDVTPYECSTAPGDYIDPLDDPAADVTFADGSRVCFTLRVDFSTTNFTRNPAMKDFLPSYLAFEPGSVVVTDGSEPATLVNTDPLRWTIGTQQGNARYTPPGSFFEVRFSAIVIEAAPGPQPDITGNLAKFSWRNSGGRAFGLRDKLDMQISPVPPITLEKAAVRAAEPGAPLADGAEVVADELLDYTVALGNDGSEANGNDDLIVGPDVWDVLPDGVTCEEISAISDDGICTDPGDADHPTFSTRDSRSAVRWDLPDTVIIAPGETRELTYQLQVPSDASVSMSYTNTASVAEFSTVSNIGTVAEHFPANNVDTTVPPEDIDAPEATDSFMVVIPDAAVAKSNTTSVVEPGNDDASAVVGELVTYEIDVTVPAHTSVYNGLLTDPLPTGLTFVSAAAEQSTDGGATFGDVDGDFTLVTSDGTLEFPPVYTNSTDLDHVLRVLVTAQVQNVDSNAHNTPRTNTASFVSTLGADGANLPARSASSTVTILDPAPSLAKQDNDDDGVIAVGEVITYTLTAANEAGRPTAHDMFVVDCVPAGLTVTGFEAGSPDQGTATFGPSDGADGCAAGTTRIEWNVGGLEAGTPRTLNYTATLIPTAPGGLVVTNTATQTSSTLDDGKAGSLDPDNPAERVFTRTASDTLMVRGAGIAKEVDEPSRAVGERATYTLDVTLPAEVNFYDAAVTDLLPAGLDLATLETESITCEDALGAPCVVDGTPLTSAGNLIGWSLGDVLVSPETRTVTIVYSAIVDDVEANVRGAALTNGATVNWNLTDGDNPTAADETWEQSSETATATVTVDEPVLSIAKRVSDTTPEPGEVFDYTVDVTNESGSNVSDAYGVTVVDTVPDGVVVQPDTISDGGTLEGATATGGGTITWVLPDPIAPGATQPLSYSAVLASPTLIEPLTNLADITRYTSIEDGGREYDGPEATATVTAALPHVVVEKAVLAGDLAYIDEPKSWQVTVTSDGEATALGVDVNDVLPPNWTYDAGSAQVVIEGGAASQIDPETAIADSVQTLTWTDLADLPVGETIVITFSATPQAEVVTTPGVGTSVDHVNEASTTAEDADGNQGPAGGGTYNGPPDTAIAHIASADVLVEKSHTGEPVAGEQFSWSVTVSNDGPDSAVGPFIVNDTLPAEVTGGTAAGPGWTCSSAGADITCTRADPAETLAAGASFPAITVTANVPADLVAGTELVNAVEVSAKSYDPDLTNNADTDEATTAAKADLSIEKRLVGEMVAGTPATYTLDVTNLGPSISLGEVTVTDTLPTGTTLVSATGSDWTCTDAANVVTCTHPGPVGLEAMPQIAITIDVPADQLDPLTNTASVDGPLDDNPDNDTDSVTTTPGTSADLAVQKESTSEFVAGDQGTYSLIVDNYGPSDAQAPVQITDTLPDMLTYADFVAITGDWTCSAAGQDVTCTLAGPLPLDGQVEVEIAVDIDSTHTGPITNSATVSSGTPDPDEGNNTDSDDTGVNTRADLSIAKSHTGPVVAGESVTYDLAVRNDGPSLSPPTISVSDVLPTGMSYAGFTGAAWSCAAAGQVVTCDLDGPLGADSDAPPLSITADVAADAGPATLVNAATVGGPLADPNPENNNATDPTRIIDQANLTLAKSVTGADPVNAGEEATFEVVVSNEGPSDADTVVVSDTLPAGLSFVSAAGDGWDCSSSAPIVCGRDSIAAGADAPVITVVALVGAGVPDGSELTNVADVSTATPGDDPADNSDTATVGVQARADLVLSKVHAGGDVVAGTPTTFTIGVRNDGPSDAVGPLVITDTLPEGMSYLTAAGGWSCLPEGADVICSLPGNLLAGAAAPDLQLTVQIDASVGPQDLTNVAVVESATVDPNLENNTDEATVEVAQVADLSIVKSHVGTGLVGEEFEFTLDVANAGPSDATGVVVTDTLPEGLDFISAAGPGWACTEDTLVVTCDLDGPLAPDTAAAPITLTVLVQPGAYPTATNTADVVSEAGDPNPDNNFDTDELTVEPLVNLTIDKRHEGDFKVGEEGVFTLEVGNEGPTPAPGPITVSDTLPEGLTYVAAAGEGWTCTDDAGTISCEHGELGVDETSLIEVTVLVGPTAYPSVTNVATVVSDSTETDDTDNAAEDPVTVIPLVVLSLAKDLVSVSKTKAVFDLTVTNEGPNDTVGPVKIVDKLPTGLSYVSASGPGWNCTDAGRTVTCLHDGVIAVADDSTVRLVTKVTAAPGSQLTNSATVTGGGSDEPASDDAVADVPPDDATDPAPIGFGLPDTGGPLLWWLVAGLVLLLAGGVLLTIFRRRSGIGAPTA